MARRAFAFRRWNREIDPRTSDRSSRRSVRPRPGQQNTGICSQARPGSDKLFGLLHDDRFEFDGLPSHNRILRSKQCLGAVLFRETPSPEQYLLDIQPLGSITDIRASVEVEWLRNFWMLQLVLSGHD